MNYPFQNALLMTTTLIIYSFRTDDPSMMPLKSRKEDERLRESDHQTEELSFTYEGSADAASAAPMGMKMS